MTKTLLMAWRLIARLSAALALVVIPVHAMAQALKLGMAQGEAVQDVAAKLLTDIYKRAGLNAAIEPLPPARITILVLRDEIDGEVARIAPYFDKYPRLVKVEPAYYQLVTTAFAKSGRNISISSAEDLKNYRVGIIRGVAHAAIATEGVPNLTVTDSVAQLFRMLDKDRIDIAVDVNMNGQDTINRLGLKTIQPVGHLATRDFYNALIPSRSDLVLTISETIKAMKKNGELDKLARAYERERLAIDLQSAR